MQDFTLKKNKLENALYIIATPIGNLGDITLRALDVLRDVDIVVCEDSRVSARLLKNYNIEGKKFIIYNEQSGENSRKKILESLVLQKSLALVSDAGTPIISDPGHKLISFLRKFNQKIIPIPGVSSVTAAICASGIACDNFLFLGFLPNSKIQKENYLKSLPKNFTFIFFESANRVVATLELILKNLGDRNICVARELTKIYEQIISDNAKNIIKFFNENPDNIRGEFVIIVEKISKNDQFSNEEIKEQISKSISLAISLGHSLKDLSKNLSEIYGINKKEIYQMALLESNSIKINDENR